MKKMNNIIINPHCCTEEEYQKLKNYLTNKNWDWQEISSGEEREKEKYYWQCPSCQKTAICDCDFTRAIRIETRCENCGEIHDNLKEI